MAPVLHKNINVVGGKYDKHFKEKSNSESLKRLIVKRILLHEATSSDTLMNPELISFIEFVSMIGIEKFKKILLQTVNYYVDSEGIELYDDVKQKIFTSLI
jgi:hypothetical protein